MLGTHDAFGSISSFLLGADCMYQLPSARYVQIRSLPASLLPVLHGVPYKLQREFVSERGACAPGALRGRSSPLPGLRPPS